MKKFFGKILVGSVIFVMAVVLFSCSVVPELIIPSDGDSNGNNNTNDNTNVGVITRFTITSPANGSSVCVPFTISGTKSTNVETVSLSYPMKDAQINGSNWNITIDTNDVGLGNIQFTISAKDTNSSILTNISIILNVTNNGSGEAIHIIIISPPSGSSVGVPFTITGTKSTNVETVSLSYPMKNAQINGSNWTITINSNEVGLGNLEFSISAKDEYMSTLSSISTMLNITNNGSTNVLVHIVGQMTNHFSSEWKAYIWGSMPTIYGSADGSGNFDIPVVSMRGNSWIGAFKDDNGNGVLDDGEYDINCCVDGKLVNIQGTNISNVYINIPDINSRVISGNVTGNIFGLPLGIVIKHSFSGSGVAYYYTVPNTSESFSYSITVSGNASDNIDIGYYIDDNGDGEWTYNLDNFIFESSRFGFAINFTFPDSSTNVDMHLCGKMIDGTVTGSGATDFDCIYIDIGGGESIYTAINTGSYACGFYINTNEMAPMMNSIQVFIDQNANIIWEMHEKSVSHTNWGFPTIGDGTVVTTNTRDFVIDKITQIGIIEGNAAAEFKLAKDLGGAIYDVQNAPYSWTDYMFQGDTMTSFDLTAFIDVNDNGQNDDNYVSFSSWEPAADVVTNKFFIRRGVVDLTINGSYAGFTHPMIRNRWQNKAFHYELNSSHTLTNYWETNSVSTFLLKIYAFDDTNNNSTYQTNATWSEPLIATNSGGDYVATWTNFVTTTNFTLYITN